MTPEEWAAKLYQVVGMLSYEDTLAAIASAYCEAVAAEREACAKVADEDLSRDVYLGGYSVQDVQRVAADRIAEKIRARKDGGRWQLLCANFATNDQGCVGTSRSGITSD